MVRKDRIDAIRLLAEKVRQEIASLSSTIHTLKLHLEELNRQMHDLNSRMAELQTDELPQAPIKGWQLTMKWHWNKDRLEQTDALRSQYALLQSEYDTTEQRLKDLNAELATMQHRDEELQSMMEELHRKELSALYDRHDEETLDSYGAVHGFHGRHHPYH